ncbi:Retrovirus-related Pol polyprotein from transposon TNT 1-94 [Vitis vinifera]|uniref:Retrovirus-related Pol polyprotein from transposon TNT 1-94 n=1 Tax=Vitis vinifera TaxID=29760 RepID=A0A438EBE3_VITVI|nr:Retrovirus-related Pol polyprotein from transposon TNT 1-94 [Vitis vinifera]
MAEEAGKASGIEKFDGTDFAYWRMQIEDYLYGRKLHLPLLGTKPESMKVEEWALLDRQVLGVIRLTLSRSVAHNVVKEKTTADLMKALSGMYEKPSANNKVHLMKKLFNLKMAENASVAQHLNEFNTITNQLSSVEIDFDDEIRALIVLASLPNGWEAMRMAVSNSTGKEKLKYNDIRDLILAEEIRRRDAGETSGSGSALNLETRGRGNNRIQIKVDQIPEILIGTEANLDQANKYNAGIMGKQVTLKRQCKSPKKKNEDDFANVVTEENYVAGDFGKVYLADGSALDVVGLGDVRISLPNRSVWLLEKVRHIPDLRRNLISVGQLDDEEHAILFVGGTWKVTKELGLGHMSEKRMKMLLSKGKLPELKSIDFDMCESCILGKQKNVSFLKIGRTPKAEKLELVHTDLWGPSPVASLGGSRYYITFIDNSKTGLKVKCLRSDNGGEYIDGGFSEYCAAQGIRMEKTIPGTPQQNGVAERMNKSLNERARSMRLHAGLPKTFWADAVSTATY